MNRSRPEGRGRGGGNRPQGIGGIGGNNLSRQRPQPVNAGAGILGDGPSLMAVGMKPGQFKPPPGVPHMSPPGGMRNVSPGMQGRTRPPPQQFGGEKQNNQMQSSFRESQLQMMNSLLMKQQQQINVGRASLHGNMEGSMTSSGRERNNFQSNNLVDDGHRSSMPRDLMSDSGYHDNMGRRGFPTDDMSNNTRGGVGILGQSSMHVGRSLLDDNLGQDNSIRESRRQDFYDDGYHQDNMSRDYGHGGRSSLLGENIGRSDNLKRSSFLGDNRGQDQSRRSTIGDDLNRSSYLGSNINVSGAGILDGGSSLLSNMQDAIFSQNNQMQGLDGQGSSMQGIMGHGGSMQGIMGQGGNMQNIMGQGGNMVGQQGGNLQGIMGQQGGNRQGMRGQGRTNQSPGILGPGGGSQGIMGPGGGSQGIMGPGPQLGGEQSSIPSLFDIGTNKRGGILGKRTSYGGRDQSGQKRFRRNSGPSPQDTRRQGNRNDRSSDSRGRSRGTDRRNNRPDRTSSNDRRNWRDSDSSRSRDSDRKSHSTDRKSHDRSKTHDKKGENKDEYDPAEPTEDEEVQLTKVSWIEKKDVEMTDKSEKTDDEVVIVETKTSTPSKDEDVPDTTMTVTIDSKGRSVNDSALVKKETREDMTSPKTKDKGVYCYACKLECHDFEGFARHMKSKKHLNRMANLGSAHIQVSEQQVSRMKAEEHLRTVEKKPRNEDHNRRGDHSPRRGSTDRRSNRDRRRHRERDYDELSNASFPGDLGDMVTVDEIGFEDQDDIYMETDDVKKETGQDDDYVIPDYDPNVSFGKNYVIPVSGYFCKLCHKFYSTETAAKSTHCRSKQHYDKFHDVMMNKLMAKVLGKTEENKETQKEIERGGNEKDKNSESDISVKVENEEVEKKKNDEGKIDDENLDKTVNGEQVESVEKTEEEQTDQSQLSITESEEKMDVIEMDEKKKGEEKEENEPEEELIVTVSKTKNKAIKKVAQKAKRGKKT